MLLKRTIRPPTSYNARAQWPRVLKEGRVKRCGTCTFLVPEGDITVEDGAEHCPMCKDTMTAEWKANEENSVAQVKSDAIRRLFQPPQFSVRSLQETEASAVNSITDSAGNWLTQTTPLRMVRNTATTVLLNGVRFSSTDTITYPTGITDNSAVVRTSTLTTLNLIANPGMAAGSYSLTFNGHVYRNIFSVR